MPVRNNDVLAFGAEDPAATRSSLVKRLRVLGDQPSWREFFDTYWKLICGVTTSSARPTWKAKTAWRKRITAFTQWQVIESPALQVYVRFCSERWFNL
jgi:hypothetical protein